MFDSGPLDSLLCDGDMGLAAPTIPLLLTSELGAFLMSPDADPFAIDSEQSFELSPDADVFVIDPDRTSEYWY